LKLTGQFAHFFISIHYGAEGVGVYSFFNVIISLLAVSFTLGMENSTMQVITKIIVQHKYENLKLHVIFHIFISGTLTILI